MYEFVRVPCRCVWPTDFHSVPLAKVAWIGGRERCMMWTAIAGIRRASLPESALKTKTQPGTRKCTSSVGKWCITAFTDTCQAAKWTRSVCSDEIRSANGNSVVDHMRYVTYRHLETEGEGYYRCLP